MEEGVEGLLRDKTRLILGRADLISALGYSGGGQGGRPSGKARLPSRSAGGCAILRGRCPAGRAVA